MSKSPSKMQWGITKMLYKDHKEDCDKLYDVLKPMKTTPNFPNCFAKDDSNPDKVTIEKLGAMNSKVFGKYTKTSFAAQVRTQGNKVLREDLKNSELIFLFIREMSFLTYVVYTSL